MKQGTIFFRIVILILLVVVLAYFGSSATSSLQDSLLTAIAVEYEAGDTYLCSGYFVRDEQPLQSSSAITIPTLSEGEKVGVGQVVANCYASDEAQRQHAEVLRLEQQLQQLIAASSAGSDPVSLDNSIRSSLAALRIQIGRRNLRATDSLNTDLRSLVLRRYADDADLASISGEIASVSSQIAQLNAQTGAGVRAVTATQSGHFSGSVDGYEAVLTPDALKSITVRQFNALPSAAAEPDGTAFGKMIYGDSWYFVTTIPAEYAAALEKRSTVDVSFLQGITDTVSMKIDRIGEAENDQCVLVLSYRYYLANITSLREQSANLIFNSYSGLRVPKAAIRMDDQQSGVYVLEGSTARWKPITVLCEFGDYYVAALDKSDTDNLWPGDEIIVNAKDLYDGKVVS